MMKLFIADDEEIIRNGIKENVAWTDNGITICGEACDGDEAFELIKATNPDIAILDIRMPGLSGIEIIEALQSTDINTKIIILSGYDDFSYAQNALKMGVTDYLLKPCRSKDILKAVLNVKALIEKEELHKKNFTTLKDKYEESIPIIKERLLTSLLQKDFIVNEKILHDFDRYEISIENKNILALVIKIDDYQTIFKMKPKFDIELIRFAVKNVTEEILHSKAVFEIFSANDSIVILINASLETYDNIIELIISAQDYIKSNLWFSISVGVGTIYNSLEDTNKSYIEAKTAVDYSFFTGSNSINQYKKIPTNDESLPYPKSEEQKIINAIILGERDTLELCFSKYINVLISKHHTKENMGKSCIDLLQNIHRMCLEKIPALSEQFNQISSENISTLEYDDINQYKIKLLENIMVVFDTANNKKVHNHIVSKVIKFINENYEKPLSLELVAEKVFINPKYLSTLFKQSTGENFTDYLQKMRIDKSCELLKNTHLKIYEISNKAGYTDTKYFCQVFKKVTGLTPSQYRKTI